MQLFDMRLNQNMRVFIQWTFVEPQSPQFNFTELIYRFSMSKYTNRFRLNSAGLNVDEVGF